MKDKEIEIQVKIEKSEPLRDFLRKNAVFKSDHYQVDDYFSPSWRDFLKERPIREWLRIRDLGGRYFLTYKNWHFDENGKSHYCDEYETEIKDKDQMKKILIALGFRFIVRVEKQRQVWEYKDYKIALDSVKGLGDFVEIEYLGNEEKDPAIITAEMIAFLKENNCGRIKRNYLGYPFMLLFPKEIEYEEF